MVKGNNDRNKTVWGNKGFIKWNDVIKWLPKFHFKYMFL